MCIHNPKTHVSLEGNHCLLQKEIYMKVYEERHEIYLTRCNTGLRPIMLTISLLLVSLFFLLRFLHLPLRFQLECLLLNRINLVVNYRNLGFDPE
jgi:hypothetical protein